MRGVSCYRGAAPLLSEKVRCGLKFLKLQDDLVWARRLRGPSGISPCIDVSVSTARVPITANDQEVEMRFVGIIYQHVSLM